MYKTSYYIINSITLYRLVVAPVLLFLMLMDQVQIFKWLLIISFFTDAIDGFLARTFKISSILGARLDSIADDLTIVVAIIALVLYQPGFIQEQWVIIVLLLVLYAAQNILALMRYGRLTGFHTYLAKTATVFQGLFLMSAFFVPQPLEYLFYTGAFFTALDLVEEIILVMLLPKWEANVKGLYWIQKRKEKVQ